MILTSIILLARASPFSSIALNSAIAFPSLHNSVSCCVSVNIAVVSFSPYSTSILSCGTVNQADLKAGPIEKNKSYRSRFSAIWHTQRGVVPRQMILDIAQGPFVSFERCSG